MSKEMDFYFINLKKDIKELIDGVSIRVGNVEKQLSDTHSQIVSLSEDIGYIKGTLPSKVNKEELNRSIASVKKINNRILVGIISLLASIILTLTTFIIKGCTI